MEYQSDYYTTNFVKTVLRRAVQLSRRHTQGNAEFDAAVLSAVAAARKELELPAMDPGARKQLIDRIVLSLTQNLPYELVGETYCSRRRFYYFRSDFVRLVALHMGVVDSAGKRTGRRRNGRHT